MTEVEMLEAMRGLLAENNRNLREEMSQMMDEKLAANNGKMSQLMDEKLAATAKTLRQEMAEMMQAELAPIKKDIQTIKHDMKEVSWKVDTLYDWVDGLDIKVKSLETQ